MTRPHAVSLSDRQLKLVQQAAASIPVEARDAFLRQIADHLIGTPTDHAVAAAVNAALDRAKPPLFLCDSKPPPITGKQAKATRFTDQKSGTVRVTATKKEKPNAAINS